MQDKPVRKASIRAGLRKPDSPKWRYITGTLPEARASSPRERFSSLAASLWHKGGFKTRPYKLRDRDVLPVRGLRDACHMRLPCPESGRSISFFSLCEAKKIAQGSTTPQRALMSAASFAPDLFGPWFSAESLRACLLWLPGFSGALVFIEPSPYEYVATFTVLLFALTGMSLRGAIVPLIVLLLLMLI